MDVHGSAAGGVASNTSSPSPRTWLRTAQLVGLGLLVITPLAAVMSLTVGLVTGLVVLMVPAYLVLVWLAVTAIVVCLSMWRQRPRLARWLGISVGVAPGVLAVSLYARASADCGRRTDAQACYDYLNGSPLLPLLVVASGVVAVAVAVAVWFATSPPRRT